MKKVFVALFLVIVIAVPVALYFAANYFFKKQLEYAVQELGMANTLSWNKSGISIFGRSAYISGVKTGDITADKITFSRFSYKRNLTVQIDNLTVPVSPTLGKFYEPAYLMGYNAFHVDTTVNFTLNGNMLDVSASTIDIVEIGKPGLFLSFDNMTSERIIPAITSIIKNDKSLSAMRFTLDNAADSVTRAVNVLAQATGTDYDHAQKRILDALSRLSKADTGNTNLLQLHRLIESPASVALQLTKTVQPKTLMPETLTINDITEWRKLAQWFLALPISVAAY